MREYKFRAWSKSQNRFVYRDECVMILNSDGSLDIRKTECWDMDFEEVNDDIVLMQYTGLKDKNRTEIYVGDILELSNGVRVVVEFAHGCFGARDDTGFSPLLDSLWGIGGAVIGNIYENPELLKGESA